MNLFSDSMRSTEACRLGREALILCIEAYVHFARTNQFDKTADFATIESFLETSRLVAMPVLDEFQGSSLKEIQHVKTQ